MRISLRFTCPECGHGFPLYIGLARGRFRRGPLSALGYQCPACGTLSRQTVAWLRALWAWPLAAVTVYLAIWLFRSNSALAHLRVSLPAVLYGGLAGLSLLPAAVLMRVGLTFAAVSEATEAARRPGWRIWLWPAVTLAAIVFFGVMRHDWATGAIGLGVGSVVWGVLYLTARKGPREVSEHGDGEGRGDGR